MANGGVLFSRLLPLRLVARPNPRLASFSSGGCLAFLSSDRSFACLAVALGRGMSGVSLGPRLTPLLELTAAV